MKILFVTSYPLEYNTSANIRNLGLIQGFFENGHQVGTFSSYPNDPLLCSGEKLDFPFTKRYWIGPKTTIVVDHTKKTIAGRLKSAISGLFSKISVYDSRAMLARIVDASIIEEDYDCIVSSSDPKSAHLLAEKLIRKTRRDLGRWIQYWGDPFSNDISEDHKLLERRVIIEEKRLLSLADKVVYVSPFTLDEQAVKFPGCAGKMAFLPIPFYAKKSESNEVTDKELVGYLGDYNSKNRNIIPFVNAVKKNNIRTVIAGTSDVVISSTDHLTVYGRLQGKAIDDLSTKVGVLVCICNLRGTQIPGKVYHYVNSGKPILIVLDGDRENELKAYFEGYKRFYMCKNNTDDIGMTLKRIISEYHSFETPESLASKGISYSFLNS